MDDNTWACELSATSVKSAEKARRLLLELICSYEDVRIWSTA